MATKAASARLVQRLLQGEVRAVARVVRLVDDRAATHLSLLKELYTHTGRAWVLGVTGSPGAGKSTLVDRLVEALRQRQKRVAVVAVDPTSPFSGGAILGDRIRMQQHFLDSDVFIRSLATRGHLGGLSRSAADVIAVLDAAGFDVVIVETVGVGQDELDVARFAHTTLVVTAPGMGDDIQAIKAGILEVADVFAVNKADRPGADATMRQLEQMIALGQQVEAATTPRGHGVGRMPSPSSPRNELDGGRWLPPIIKTTASDGMGVEALLAACERHHTRPRPTDEARREHLARTRHTFLAVLRETAWARLEDRLEAEIRASIEALHERTDDPYSATERLLEAVWKPVPREEKSS